MSFKDFFTESENTDENLEGDVGYTEEELAEGTEVEMEHTDLYQIFEDFAKENDVELPLTLEEFCQKIAEAHLKESNEYYKKLKEMESTFGAEESDEEPVEDLDVPVEESSKPIVKFASKKLSEAFEKSKKV